MQTTASHVVALALLALRPVYAQPTTIVECRIEKVAVDFGAVDFDDISGFVEASPVWMCCPPDEPEDNDLAGCKVLYGDFLDQLLDSDPKGLFNFTVDGLPAVARNAPGIKRGALKSFGDHDAIHPVSIDRGRGFTRGNGAGKGGGGGHHHRRLQTTTGGAKFVDRTAYHGSRSVLSIIVGVAKAVSGEQRTWTNGASSCTEANIGNLMFGRSGGVRFAVGGSPWAHSTSCRTAADDGKCLFNVADNLASLSRGAVTLNDATSHEILLSTVSGWPDDFCHWGSVWTAIKNTLDLDGRYDWRTFNHLAAFVPSHCAIGQGMLPGKNTINANCPGSGKYEHLPAIASHEIGHNIGFHHGGFGTNEYGDRSSVMGYATSDKTSTLALAHRKMFDWLPSLPSSLHSNTDEGTADLYDRTVTLHLADVNRETLPSGAVWGAEIHDGLTSWFVSYRGCTGYDYATLSGWCGVVQVSSRVDGSTKSLHHAALKNAGDTFSFGTNGFATVSLPASAPLKMHEVTGTQEVVLRVDRGDPEPFVASPSPPSGGGGPPQTGDDTTSDTSGTESGGGSGDESTDDDGGPGKVPGTGKQNSTTSDELMMDVIMPVVISIGGMIVLAVAGFFVFRRYREPILAFGAGLSPALKAKRAATGGGTSTAAGVAEVHVDRA